MDCPIYWRGNRNSESEDEEGESRADEENPERLQLALLKEKLRHLAFETRESIVSSIYNSGIVSWSLDDLRPVDVPVSHSFEIGDPRPISHTVGFRHATMKWYVRSFVRSWNRE